ncbi:MAG: hypothetical protein HKN09_06260 [Saprospiraceae bacterium]|nr:hypothetical protein [Saprospiraceae bacterium]
MKNLIFIFFALFSITLMAQEAAEEAPKDVILQTVILEPELESLPQLMENLAAHNKKYHPEGTPYQATVFQIATGPNIGKMVWMMGPLTWADLDNRPSGDGHDEDWVTNVVSLLEDVDHGEYWKLDVESSKNPGAEQYKMYYIRYHEFDRTNGYRGNDAFDKIAETMKAIDDAKHWAVYDNQFRQGVKTGRHMATVSGMNSWAEMEDNWKFRAKFKELHGNGAWDNFLRDMDAAITNSWDEIWVYNAKLSGREE